MSSLQSCPCPICFEVVGDSWQTQKAWYHAEDNHSWINSSRCDSHHICWNCLAKHVEIQVLSEGKSSVRCPGVGCRYHLLQKDVEYALWGSSAQDTVLETLARVSSQSCQDRLKEIVSGNLSGRAAQWLLQQCQPCPKCFVLSRRETGCNHIVCRCGCDFCFGCGSPSEDPCLCGSLSPDCRQGSVFFAAWLRVSRQSPCEWLWEGVANQGEQGPSSFLPTLGFWLWIAGAEIPVVWDGTACHQETESTSVLPQLTLLEGAQFEHEHYDDMFYTYSDCDTDLEEIFTGEMEQDLAGHLRKELYSRHTQRSVRRGTQRRAPSRRASDRRVKDHDRKGQVKANRTLY